MRIYTVEADYDKFESCSVNFEASVKYLKPEDWGHSIQFGGVRQGDNWRPRVVELDHTKKVRLGDYVPMVQGDCMVLGKKAIEKLLPVMGEVEILPLICDFGDYWAVNILDVLDCIEYEKSEVVWLNEEERRVMYFKKYAFQPEMLRGHHLFKLIEERKTKPYADDVFVDAVNRHKITGFRFRLIWEDETVE